MKKVLPLFPLLFLSFLVFGQKISIKGQLTDSVGSALPSATVIVLQASDSSLVNFGVSDLRGFFEIKNIVHGEYIVKISFLGFSTFAKKIAPITGSLEVNLGQIRMTTRTTQL